MSYNLRIYIKKKLFFSSSFHAFYVRWVWACVYVLWYLDRMCGADWGGLGCPTFTLLTISFTVEKCPGCGERERRVGLWCAGFEIRVKWKQPLRYNIYNAFRGCWSMFCMCKTFAYKSRWSAYPPQTFRISCLIHERFDIVAYVLVVRTEAFYFDNNRIFFCGFLYA